MKILIDNKQITLAGRDVKAAKKIVLHCLDSSRQHAEEKGADAFYYTLLIVMHTLSGELINQLTPDVLAKILNSADKNSDQKQKGDN